jgi:hypothetical protein
MHQQVSLCIFITKELEKEREREREREKEVYRIILKRFKKFE